MSTSVLDKEILLVLAGWFANLSAGWFGSLFILPIFVETKPALLIGVNLPASILALLINGSPSPHWYRLHSLSWCSSF